MNALPVSPVMGGSTALSVLIHALLFIAAWAVLQSRPPFTQPHFAHIEPIPFQLRVSSRASRIAGPTQRTQSWDRLKTSQASVTEAAAPEDIHSAISQYLGRVVQLIEQAKQYPPSALADEQEGTVVLSLTIAPDGTLAEHHLRQSSTFRSLDEAALDTIRRIGSLPPFESFRQSPLVIEVPIRYQLNHAEP